MTHKKRVLFFVSPWVGGAERMTVNIAKMLNPAIWDIHFVIVGQSIEEIRKFLPVGTCIHLLKTRNIWDFTIIKMTLLMRQLKPQCVFGSLGYINCRIIIAAKIIGGIKIIVRNDNNLQYYRKDILFLIKNTYPHANYIIAQQEEMRDELVRYLKNVDVKKVLALKNPIDKKSIEEKIEEPSPYPYSTSINYLSVGRVVRQKGYDILIKSFIQVHERNKNSHLYIVGKYDDKDVYYSELKQIINNEQLNEFVHFVGFDPNPYKWMRYCDCFVMSSRFEGLPNALVEAMYLRRPVVATTCIPIIDRIVENDYNGYKVVPEDIYGLAIAMEKTMKLKDFKMTYVPSSEDEYIELFN